MRLGCVVGLGQYEQAFCVNDIDAGVLADLTVEDLIGLGVGVDRPPPQAVAAIAALRAGSIPAALIPGTRRRLRLLTWHRHPLRPSGGRSP